MAGGGFPDRIGKLLVWIAAAGPLAWLVFRTFTGRLGVNPIETLTHFTGLTALIVLLVTLSITPLRRLTGWNRLIRYRRLIGLWAFTYALLHFLVWGLFDHQFSLATITEDVVERPFITVGFTAFLILVALAITSPKAMVRRLGGKRWQKLHRLVYVAAGLGVLHYLWGVKVITAKPVVVAVVLGVLFAARLIPAGKKARETHA
ncbi:MAG TPA: protein-methionine-sulfoxide reductase heme-binding subunit MsrQ [Gemmatimonadales bacterium]|nr:protein-methionine-sulfoxide reductase heme-binding subunit MsrQ [Gemmatimonadales bacterium]